jgi:hypothetical protein
MNKAYPDNEGEASDMYERLEELLRQTVTLAGEIVEDKGCLLAGECIVVRRRSNSDPTGAQPMGPYRHDIRRSLLAGRQALKPDDSEDIPGPSPSPESSVQEPFPPGSVAVSLDAVMEKGKTPDDGLCFLGNASPTSVTSCFVEQSSNRSSLLSTEDGQHGLTAPASVSQHPSNENTLKRLHRPSFLQRNTSMIVHDGQESLAETPMGRFLPQQITQNPSTERLGRRKTPAQESPLDSPNRSRTSKCQRSSDNALEKHQKNEEGREGDIFVRDQSSPPNWHVKILPIAPSRDIGSSASSLPALVKLEVVFPLRASAQGNSMPSLLYSGEPSYFVISRPPTDSSPRSPRLQASEESASVDHERNLREFIDEWEYDAEVPEVEDRKL